MPVMPTRPPVVDENAPRPDAEIVSTRDGYDRWSEIYDDEGNPLCEAEILGDTLTCAYHGWKFDLGTGACLFGDEPARVFRAEIEDGEVVVTP